MTWQAGLVPQYRGPGQFIMPDYAGVMRGYSDEQEIIKAMAIVAVNSYHGTQDHMDGVSDLEVGDFARSLKHTNY